MSRQDASDLAQRLGREAEAFCREYLSAGRRTGNYWLVGDVQNNPGRSMFVRLTGPASGKGAAGKWTDMATGQHGDLLDIIREALGLADFKDGTEEGRRFLSLPHPPPEKIRTATGQVGADPRHPGSDLPQRTVDHLAHRRHRAALPPPVLLPARRAFAHRDLAGDGRIRYRPRRATDRRASHLARPGRFGQGACRDAEAGDGRPSRPRRSLRRGR